jgi:hypothetical protein
MSAAPPPRFAIAKLWLAVALAILLLAWGLLRYGISVEVHQRFWSHIADRVHGPMPLRFFLQPTMAFVFALIDGIKDARFGHKSFFWTLLWDPKQQRGRLREGLISIANVILFGISLDVIYQFRVFDQFYPVEALMMALLLAVIPYFVFRWIIEHIARWWFARKSAGAGT